MNGVQLMSPAGGGGALSAPSPCWQGGGGEGGRGKGGRQGAGGAEVQGCWSSRESPVLLPGIFPADVTVHPSHKTLPGSKGPLEKAIAGYYLKMKYATSEEHFDSGIRVRAVYFYKGGRALKFAVNLEERVFVGAVPAAAPCLHTTVPGRQLSGGQQQWMDSSEGGRGKR